MASGDNSNDFPCHFRYAVRLLTPSSVMAQQNGNEAVTVEDVKEAADLFMDAKTSAQMLAENPEKFMKWVGTSQQLCEETLAKIVE